MFKKKLFPPLEKVSVRGFFSLTGFTLLELLIVIVIVGVLASLGLANLKPFKEKTLLKEVQSSLSLIYSAEKIYRMETGSYYPPSGTAQTAAINTDLKLALVPTNWTYALTTCSTGTGFGGQGKRSNDASNNWCVSGSTSTPYACGSSINCN